MDASSQRELYQQIIIEHNRKPQNFGKLPLASHQAEGYNPLCGDHLNVYLQIENDIIGQVMFDGDGCAISKASASMMTAALKGKTVSQAKDLFLEFQNLITRKLDPEDQSSQLGKLKIFSGIWQFPSRVKCASLCWHTMKGALEEKKSISTE